MCSRARAKFQAIILCNDRGTGFLEEAIQAPLAQVHVGKNMRSLHDQIQTSDFLHDAGKIKRPLSKSVIISVSAHFDGLVAISTQHASCHIYQ